jgi:hypothetical protein
VLTILGARGYAASSDDVYGAVVLMGGEGTRNEQAKAWYILSKLSDMYVARDPLLQEPRDNSELQRQLLKEPEARKLEKAKTELRVLNHTTESVQQRFYRIVDFRKQHKELNDIVTKQITSITLHETAFGSMKKDLVEMNKKINRMHGSLSHAKKSDKIVTAQSGLSKIEGDIWGNVELMGLSMGKLKDVHLRIDEYQRSFQDRDHRFEDLDAHQAELHGVHSVLKEHENITSLGWVQMYIKEKAAAIEGIETPTEKDDQIIKQIKAELNETQWLMQKSIEKSLERGGKIDDLVAKSDLLSQHSKEFYTTVRILDVFLHTPAKALDMVLILLRPKTIPHVVQLCSLCNTMVLCCAINV